MKHLLALSSCVAAERHLAEEHIVMLQYTSSVTNVGEGSEDTPMVLYEEETTQTVHDVPADQSSYTVIILMNEYI